MMLHQLRWMFHTLPLTVSFSYNVWTQAWWYHVSGALIRTAPSSDTLHYACNYPDPCGKWKCCDTNPIKKVHPTRLIHEGSFIKYSNKTALLVHAGDGASKINNELCSIGAMARNNGQPHTASHHPHPSQTHAHTVINTVEVLTHFHLSINGYVLWLKFFKWLSLAGIFFLSNDSRYTGMLPFINAITVKNLPTCVQ